MGEQLRKLSGFENVPLNIAQGVITESLDDLRDVEEGHVDGTTLQRSHGKLENEMVVAILRQEVSNCRNRIDRSPVEEMLSCDESVRR
jgi:hypothetical protein